MVKKYALAIANVVRVPVKVDIKDADGKEKFYKFSLVCKRLGAEETAEVFKTMPAYDFMMANTTGWDGQRLVLEDDGTPAAFCPDALAALFDISGLLLVCFNAYVKASNAIEKT